MVGPEVTIEGILEGGRGAEKTVRWCRRSYALHGRSFGSNRKESCMRYLYVMSIMALGSVATMAQDQPAEPGGGGFPVNVLSMMLIMFAIIYFLMIRPEQKKQKERQSMMSSLQKGDKVLTIGGLHGQITNVKDNVVMVRIADNTVVEVAKTAVSSVINRTGADEGGSKKG